MHLKIPQGHLIQKKKKKKNNKLEKHICILFFSHLSHAWKWWLQYYPCDILNALYLVREICLRDLPLHAVCQYIGHLESIL